MGGKTEAEALAADILFETAKDLGAQKEAVMTPPKDQGPKGPIALVECLERMVAAAPSAVNPNSAMTYGQLQLFKTLQGFEEAKAGVVAGMSESLEEFRVQCGGRARIAAYRLSNRLFPEVGSDYQYKGKALTRSTF